MDSSGSRGQQHHHHHHQQHQQLIKQAPQHIVSRALFKVIVGQSDKFYRAFVPQELPRFPPMSLNAWTQTSYEDFVILAECNGDTTDMYAGPYTNRELDLLEKNRVLEESVKHYAELLEQIYNTAASKIESHHGTPNNNNNNLNLPITAPIQIKTNLTYEPKVSPGSSKSFSPTSCINTLPKLTMGSNTDSVKYKIVSDGTSSSNTADDPIEIQLADDNAALLNASNESDRLEIDECEVAKEIDIDPLPLDETNPVDSSIDYTSSSSCQQSQQGQPQPQPQPPQQQQEQKDLQQLVEHKVALKHKSDENDHSLTPIMQKKSKSNNDGHDYQQNAIVETPTNIYKNLTTHKILTVNQRKMNFANKNENHIYNQNQKHNVLYSYSKNNPKKFIYNIPNNNNNNNRNSNTSQTDTGNKNVTTPGGKLSETCASDGGTPPTPEFEFCTVVTDGDPGDSGTDNIMVSIGPNDTRVPAKLYETMNWTSASIATRKLLVNLFGRDVLATHSMTGKPSPAFKTAKKPLKQMLDPNIIQDIVFVVTRKCNVSEKEVRSAITTKCADENKMMKLQISRKKSLLNDVVNKENLYISHQEQSPSPKE